MPTDCIVYEKNAIHSFYVIFHKMHFLKKLKEDNQLIIFNFELEGSQQIEERVSVQGMSAHSE